MALEWGVTPLSIPEGGDVEDLWSVSLAAARNAGIVAKGDRVVITAGTAVNIPGSTNGNFQQANYSIPSVYTGDQYLANADWLINSRNTLAMRYFFTEDPQTKRGNTKDTVRE